MKRFGKASLLLVIFLILISCATLGITPPKPYSEMTAKEKMVFFYAEYNKQYQDYLVQVAKPNLTDTEKTVLRSKKQTLIKLYPWIQALDLALVEGKPFDPTIEKLIIDSLRQLGTKVQ